MAGPKLAAVLLATKYFKRYQAEIVRLLNKQRGNATESDDAGLLLNTYNAEALLKPARDSLAAHVLRRDNPHEETMETIGSYSKTSVVNKVSAKIPNSVVPVSTYGIFDNLDDAAVDAAWTFKGWELTCNRALKIVLSGNSFTLPITAIDLSKVEDPVSKTFYVYVRGQFGIYNYQARTDSPPESAGVMYIGKVVCGPNGIVSKSFKTVVRLDTFRLSNEPVGSAIPVTKGTFDAVTPLSTAWNPS